MEPIDITDSNEENNNTILETMANRQVRRLRYRQILDKVEELEATGDTSLETVNEIGAVFEKVNNLDSQLDIQERVKNPDEIVLQAKILSAASKMVVKSLRSIDISLTTYEPKEFAQKLIKFMDQDDNNIDLMNLTKCANRIIPDRVSHYYLYGAYDLNIAPQPPPRKQREKAIRENLTKKQPENVTEVTSDEKGINEIVQFLFNVLCDEYNKQKRNYINYYDYIIDIEDYGRTIENMFYFAFLIRDGRAGITLENNVPMIKPLKGRSSKAAKDESLKNSQIVASISMKDWKQFKKPGYLQNRKQQMPRSSGKR